MRVIFSLLIYLLSILLFAQDTLTIDRLDYRFVSYEDGLMEPIISLEDAEVAGVLVTCEADVQVELCGPLEFDIWVDGRFIGHKGKERCRYFTMEQLCQVAKRDTIYLSIVGKDQLKGVRARTFLVKESTIVRFEILRRNGVSEFLYFGFIGCAALLVLLRTSLSSQRVNLRLPNFNSYSARFFTGDNLTMQIVSIILTSFSMTLISGAVNFINWINAVFILLIGWIVLLSVTYGAASIYKFRKQANWQMNFAVRGWFGISLLIFIFQFFDSIFFYHSLLSTKLLTNIIILVLAIFALIVGYVFMSQRGTKSLHIFVYLCTTEILPVSMVIYWLLE